MGRVMALDPGTKRVGVAISDSGRTLGFPRPALSVDDGIYDAVAAIASEEMVDFIVIGRPTSLSGRETSSTEMADEFILRVQQAIPGVKCSFFDERLTTVSAQKSLREAGVRSKDQRPIIDSATAVVILQSFLDA